MKIALVCKTFSLKKGGLEKYTVGLAVKLLELGHQVHVLAHKWEPLEGVIFHYIPMLRTSPGKNLSFAFHTKRILEKSSYDVVHSMERIMQQDIFRASEGINPVRLRLRYPNAFIRMLQAIGPRMQVLRYLERTIFIKQGCRYIMTNSKLVRDHIITHYKVDPQRIHVIYNSVDTSRFNLKAREQLRPKTRRSLGITDQQPLLLFISNNFKLKRLDLIIDALGRLPHKIKLVVLGSDNPTPYLRRAAQYKLNDQIHFAGHQTQVEKFYAAADIMILPTLYDAFANVCLEAMAMGLPVITSAANGVAELIENQKHGFVLTAWDHKELAARIKDILAVSDPGQMSKTCAHTAAAFTQEKHIKKLLHLYEKVIKQ